MEETSVLEALRYFAREGGADLGMGCCRRGLVVERWVVAFCHDGYLAFCV